MLNVCFFAPERGFLKFALRGETVDFGYTNLSYGRIPAEYFDDAREEYFAKIHSSTSRSEIKNWVQKEHDRFQSIIETINCDGKVRVWLADNPDSRCGLYHLMHSLQGVDCKILIVELPEDIDAEFACRDKIWRNMCVDDVSGYLSLQREFDLFERDSLAKQWERLVVEDAELRVNIDGEIKSVAVDYLDGEILSCAPLGKKVNLGWLVGEVILNSKHFMDCGFIENRIEAMIDKGIIKVIKRNKDSEHKHSTVICVLSHEIN